MLNYIFVVVFFLSEGYSKISSYLFNGRIVFHFAHLYCSLAASN